MTGRLNIIPFLNWGLVQRRAADLSRANQMRVLGKLPATAAYFAREAA